MKKIKAKIIILITLLTCCLPAINAKPVTIPALRSWSDASGKYDFSTKAVLVADTKSASVLMDVLSTFNDDLINLKGFKLSLKEGINSTKGDIYFSLDSSLDYLGDEGYSMEISDRIIIKAVTVKGCFYATRTLLQLLKNCDTIPAGTAYDWPSYKIRELMVDNGRQYFTPQWLENHIKELSYIKMNRFHWHFSDNEGFRIESSTHPEVVSNEFLTFEEVYHLLDVAKKYHVEILPEIDMPGHMGTILEKYPQFTPTDTSGGKAIFFLDVTSNEARKLAAELLDEYMDLFPGTSWQLGGDEYLYSEGDMNRFPEYQKFARSKYGSNAIGTDAIFDFMNWSDSIAKKHGKTGRVWNDCYSKGFSKSNIVSLNKDIIIEYTNGEDQPSDAIKAGYCLTNTSQDFFYYNIGCGWLGYDNWLYESWKPHIFQGNKTVSQNDKNNLGSKYCIWCDHPGWETEGHIAKIIKKPLRIIAQGLWGTSKIVSTHDEFTNIIESIGRAPGVSFPVNPMPGNLCFGKKAFASSNGDFNNSAPVNTLDANYNTPWASVGSENEWIYVDLDSIYNINRIKLVWIRNFPDKYYIQTSNDAINWVTIDSSKSSQQVDDYTKLSGSGRYVRVFCKKTGYSFFTLWEIEVYGSVKYTDTLTESENKVDFSLDIKPNPSKEEFIINIYSNDQLPLSIFIFDEKGNKINLVFSGLTNTGKNSFVWMPGNLPEGCYLCQISCGDRKYVQKLILTR